MDTLRIYWEGHDGSVWDLLDPTKPTFAVSIDGMGLPGFVQQWTKSGARDGQRYEGTTWDANTITLTVQVGDTYPQPGQTRRRHGQEWRDLDREFRKSFSAEQEGRLVVVSDAGRRSLGLRLDAPLIPPADGNPALSGSAIYVIGLIAGDEPWWLGDPIEAVFQWSFDDEPFFTENSAEDQIALYIAADTELDVSQIYNPGDREAWPRWWVKGPVQEVHVGVGDDYAVLPFAVGAENRVYVDSYEQTITDEAGNNLWPLMGYSDPVFVPVPAGEQVLLNTSLVEAGDGAAIGVTIRPRYEGPW